MHILLVADGRSPISNHFIQGLLALQHRVTLVSTYPCRPPDGLENLYVLPVAFGGLAGGQTGGKGAPQTRKSNLQKAIRSARPLFLWLRYTIGPLTLPGYGRRLKRLISQTQPDLVHALRLPFEGMLASYTPPNIPLAVTIWGNDLTFHGNGSPMMKRLTRRALKRANGLLADASRDIRLSRQWGYPFERPTLVIPGSGGIDLVEMNQQLLAGSTVLDDLGIPNDAPIVINPRGFRPGSVRNDAFFSAIPLVLERIPFVQFLCPAMRKQPEAIQWIHRLNLDMRVRLLPYLDQGQLWNLFSRAALTVSVSSHDGTPNSLLEAMACGCFPIGGDIESLREWITPGVNGFLVEPDKPQALAEAIIDGLENTALRSSAAEINRSIIRQRADISLVRAQLSVFYQQLK